MDQHMKPYSGVRRIALTLGIILAVPSFIVGPLYFQAAVHEAPSQYLLPSVAASVPPTETYPSVDFPSPWEVKNISSGGMGVSWILVALISGLGGFVCVVLATCLLAEVVWWIGDGFRKDGAWEPAFYPEYGPEGTASVDEQEFQSWYDPGPEDPDVHVQEDEDIGKVEKLKQRFKQRYVM